MTESKILVVALLLVIIFLGLAVFLFFLENRLTRLEKKLKEAEKADKSKKA